MVARGIKRFRVPPPPDGYCLLRFQVGVDGRFGALFSTLDTNAAWRNAIDTRQRLPTIPATAQGLVALSHGHGWREIARFPLQSYHYAFDFAPDDFCIVADVRCGRDDLNAVTYVAGKKGRVFHAGDGINHLQCDDRGGLWVGYFDEGVFGNTIASHGIVRFTRDGEISSYLASITLDDCYSLNVGTAATWSCWYTGFPVVRLDDNCAEQRWSNDLLAGISAIAVSEPHVLLISGYPPERNRIVLGEFHLGGVRQVAAFDAREALGVDLEKVWFTARNDCFYVVNGDELLIAPISWFAERCR